MPFADFNGLLDIPHYTDYLKTFFIRQSLHKKEAVSILKDGPENRLNDSGSPIGIRIKEADSLVLRQPLFFIILSHLYFENKRRSHGLKSQNVLCPTFIYHLDLSLQPQLENYLDLFVLGYFSGFWFSNYSDITPDEAGGGMLVREGMLYVNLLSLYP